MQLHKHMIVWLGSTLLLAVLILGGGTGLAQDGDPTPTPTLIPAGSPNTDWTPIVRDFDGIPFVYVPAGCFRMGSTETQIDEAVRTCEDDLPYSCARYWFENETPPHEVCLSAFWIGQTEVTNAQYRACVEAGACTLPGFTTEYDDPAYADHPVIYMDWIKASAYAAWLECSLPTEAQWEYAARGPEAWIFPWGDGALKCDRANVDDCVGETSPVGSYESGTSWVGALDMAGNMYEWVADWYDENYYATVVDGVLNPTGPVSGDTRGLRGGSWELSQFRARAAARNSDYPDYLFYGFRVVCDHSPSRLP